MRFRGPCWVLIYLDFFRLYRVIYMLLILKNTLNTAFLLLFMLSIYSLDCFYPAVTHQRAYHCGIVSYLVTFQHVGGLLIAHLPD